MAFTRTMVLATIVAWSAAGGASAVEIFTNEAAFIAASGALDVEGFECYEDTPPDSAFPVVTPSFVVTIEPAFGSTRAPMGIYTNPGPGGPHATDGGDKLILAGAMPSTNGSFQMTFTFAMPITEFALTVTDFGDWTAGTLSIGNNVGDGYVIASNPPIHSDGTEHFIGIRNETTPFSIVVLSKSTQGDGVGVDEIYYSDLPSGTYCEVAGVGEAAPQSIGTSWSAVKTRFR